MTNLELITRALRIIGWLQPGEVPNDRVAAAVLQAANSLIGSLNLDRNMIFSIKQVDVTLNPNQQDYLIGPGAPDFDMFRPENIEPCNLVIQSSPELTRDINMVNYQEWARLPLKKIYSLPETAYYDLGYSQPTAQPNPAGSGWATLKFYPAPNKSYGVQLFCWNALSDFGTMDDLQYVWAMPPGYDRMIAYLLAAEVAGDFGRQLSPETIAIGVDAWDKVQSKNAPTPYMPSEQAFGQIRKANFSYLTGE